MRKLSKKELGKLEQQLGVSQAIHNRPPVGRPAVFAGKTNKQRRREGKRIVSEY